MAEKELIINVATGEQTYVDLTPEKLAELNEMQRVAQEQEAARIAADEARAAAREAANAKLAALGLTAEEIASL